MPRIRLGAAVLADPNTLAVGDSTMPRLTASSQSSSLGTSGALRLTFFAASKSDTVSQVRVLTGSAAAAATPTLCRIGLYSVAADGSLALIASTANDTTLFATVTTAYTKAFTASAVLAARQRYALGILVVSAAALPTFVGAVAIGGSESAMAPRLTALVASQADLPASVASGSLAASSSSIYGVLLP